ALAQLRRGGPEAEPASYGDGVSDWLGSLSGLEFHETQRFEMGRRVLSALSAPVMTPTGAQLGSVVVLRDITREVESEKLKDDFITSVSHELRTPLVAIKGYNDLLRMTATGKLDKQQMNFIETIDANAQDLLNLIQEMLDLSQIDAGELGVDHDRLNLSKLVQIEAGLWLDKMAEKELSFTINISPLPVWVEGDWNRLTWVMRNLLKNANDYTLPGGQVELSLTAENGQAQVAVKDTGVGISKEHQRFLFTRFFRAIHEESTYEVSGAGLGLYMSKAIIEAHCGQIWVETEANRGSTFGFRLPVIEPPELRAPDEEPLPCFEGRD
ncbi:MAG: HAMP domain-containing sensor histidine kinase, partial [Chloroflexota bacterium]